MKKKKMSVSWRCISLGQPKPVLFVSRSCRVGTAMQDRAIVCQSELGSAEEETCHEERGDNPVHEYTEANLDL